MTATTPDRETPRRAAPAGTGTPAISVQGLTKTFGDFTAVDQISLDVPAGQIFGFLGPNGSGKTTTIRMLTGTMRPSSGHIRILGENVIRHPHRVQPRIGYMSQKFALFEDMTVEQNLKFYAGIYDLPADRYEAQRRYVLDMADLVGRENELTRNLSVGWRQRLALGAATIHDPELLFLDEPTSGVDPVARRQFWDLLYELAGRGVTLFVTTHYMDEADHCNRLAFIDQGRIIADGSPTTLRADHSQRRIYEVTVTDADNAITWLEHADGIADAYLSGADLHAVLPADSATTSDDLHQALAAAGFPDNRVVEIAPSIEDVFVNLVGEERDKQATA